MTSTAAIISKHQREARGATLSRRGEILDVVISELDDQLKWSDIVELPSHVMRAKHEMGLASSAELADYDEAVVRSQGLLQQFGKNAVPFFGKVDRWSSAIFKMQLILKEMLNVRPIKVVIDSPGGEPHAGLECATYIQEAAARGHPIECYAVRAYSAASYLLIAPEPKSRKLVTRINNQPTNVNPRGPVMYHQLTMKFEGNSSLLYAFVDKHNELLGKVDALYRRQTKLGADFSLNMLTEDVYCTTKDAIAKGIAAVVENTV